MPRSQSSVRAYLAATAVLAAVTCCAGCSYRLQAPRLRTVESIRLAAPTPSAYTVRAFGEEHRVADDGRISFRTPMLSGGCRVFLFDRIPLSRRYRPDDEKFIELRSGGRTVKKLSLNELHRLPTDEAGARIWNALESR